VGGLDQRPAQQDEGERGQEGTPMGWTDAVQDSLKALEEFSGEYGALPDLIKSDNLMMRKDGTLVFSDPVFME
jgi:hypothetical protein